MGLNGGSLANRACKVRRGGRSQASFDPEALDGEPGTEGTRRSMTSICASDRPRLEMRLRDRAMVAGADRRNGRLGLSAFR